MNPLKTVDDWKKLFDKVNRDEAKNVDGLVVDYRDVEFYADQIHNLTDETNFPKAKAIAKALASTYGGNVDDAGEDVYGKSTFRGKSAHAPSRDTNLKEGKMSFKEFLVEWYEEEPSCEEFWCDEDGSELSEEDIFFVLSAGDDVQQELFESDDDLFEAAQRAFKRIGMDIKRHYRCVGGPKDGKISATPAGCLQRKDPAKVRHGRKISRTRKGVRIRKSAIKKKQSVSRMVSRMNKRISGGTQKARKPGKIHSIPYTKKVK